MCACECVCVCVCHRERSINLMNCLFLFFTSNHSDLLTAHIHHSTATFKMRHTCKHSSVSEDHWLHVCERKSELGHKCRNKNYSNICLREVKNKKTLSRKKTISLINQVSCNKWEGQSVNAVVLFYSSTGTWCHEKWMGLLSFTPQLKWKFKP